MSTLFTPQICVEHQKAVLGLSLITGDVAMKKIKIKNISYPHRAYFLFYFF